MPRFTIRNAVNGPRDQPTDEDAQTIDLFIRETLRNLPQRLVGVGEVIPESAADNELRHCLYALFTILKCPPEVGVDQSFLMELLAHMVNPVSGSVLEGYRVKNRYQVIHGDRGTTP
ncbi:hypothetical protein V5O48_001851 [Marasmius crinis-equi]|uniref:Uncharacterized protein n=1 Tax=Marasmius crinis-equi TaxID=585013 RepID=A0ABR3FXZ6_9AGAR